MRTLSNMHEYTPPSHVRSKQTTVRFLGMFMIQIAIRALRIIHQTKRLYARLAACAAISV